jgi:1,4-dihydroxy-6-naphthoate synthase
MKYSLGFSPCPNDTFIFFALLNKKIDAGDFEFLPVIEDVQALNEKAFRVELDITKLSFGMYAEVKHNYDLLSSGAALGHGCGPLVISKNEISDLANYSVALPGKNTTANFLFEKFFPQHSVTHQMVFSEIEDAVLNGKTDVGVIIHENRFTYQKRGLKKIADLGELWESSTGAPIPLGGIFMKKKFQPEIKRKVENLIRQSIEYAWKHPEEVIPFVRNYSQEMDESVMWQHIHLYVNAYSLDLGKDGKRAVDIFMEQAMLSIAN